MKHPMRRAKRQIDDSEALALLRQCNWGVLSTVGPDGLPYGVPLNYCLDERPSGGGTKDGKTERVLIFHAAPEGRKLDNLRHCDRAAFVAVAADELVPEKYTTQYASVMASGPVRIIDEPDAKRAGLFKLVAAIAPVHPDLGAAHIEKWLDGCVVLELVIEELSGKKRPRKE